MVTQIAMAHDGRRCWACSRSPDTVEAWHVYVLAFLFGTGAAFDTPARQAFVNEMIGKQLLANAVALELGDVPPRPHGRPGDRRRRDRRCSAPASRRPAG